MFPKRLGFQSLARLRWRFKFLNGKPDKVGVWMHSSNKFEETAAYISKTGILSASIECEVTGQWATKTMYECDGHDYISASWIAATSAGCGFNLPERTVLPTNIVGLSFLTTREKVCCFVDGTVFKKPVTKNDLKIKLREFRV